MRIIHKIYIISKIMLFLPMRGYELSLMTFSCVIRALFLPMRGYEAAYCI